MSTPINDVDRGFLLNLARCHADYDIWWSFVVALDARLIAAEAELADLKTVFGERGFDYTKVLDLKRANDLAQALTLVVKGDRAALASALRGLLTALREPVADAGESMEAALAAADAILAEIGKP